jgi:hypothetical protein
MSAHMCDTLVQAVRFATTQTEHTKDRLPSHCTAYSRADDKIVIYYHGMYYAIFIDTLCSRSRIPRDTYMSVVEGRKGQTNSQANYWMWSTAANNLRQSDQIDPAVILRQ